MARVILAMASSSTTRAGRLLSSAMGRGTALGSTLNSPRRVPPCVARLAEGCFMGDGVSGLAELWFLALIATGMEVSAAPDEDASASRLITAAAASAREV